MSSKPYVISMTALLPEKSVSNQSLKGWCHYQIWFFSVIAQNNSQGCQFEWSPRPDTKKLERIRCISRGFGVL